MKLYIITRSNLSAGLRVAQSCHAMSQFAQDHPVAYEEWYKNSNNLVVLEVDDEPTLQSLLDQTNLTSVLCSHFHEPDLENALTAIALYGNTKALVSRLRLACSRYRAHFRRNNAISERV